MLYIEKKDGRYLVICNFLGLLGSFGAELIARSYLIESNREVF
jgi:hypothetical protein